MKISSAEELQLVFKIDKDTSIRLKKAIENNFPGMSIHQTARMILTKKLKDMENENNGF